MKRSKVPTGMFGSESELLQELIDGSRAAGYRAYPECGDWDAMIACRSTGTQIGVHSKLRPNVDVLSQALSNERLPGPEIHAVLVPASTPQFTEVARALRIFVIEGVRLDWLDLPGIYRNAVRWAHPSRHWVPEVEMRFPAGVPAPRKSTPWKIAAVKLCMMAREKGFVTRAEMRELDLDPRFWVDRRHGALMQKRMIDGVLQRGEYVLRDPSSRLVPDLKFPEITSALQEERLKVPRVRMKQAKPRSTLIPPPTEEAEAATTGLSLRVPTNEQFLEEGLAATRK